MDYSKLVKEIRTTLNLSQEELARELHISYATVNRWENSKVIPSKLAKRALLEYCNQNELLKIIIEKHVL